MTPLRPWQRLSVRLAALFVAVTLIGVGLVGGLIYEHQKWDLEETLGEVLLNIARTGVGSVTNRASSTGRSWARRSATASA